MFVCYRITMCSARALQIKGNVYFSSQFIVPCLHVCFQKCIINKMDFIEVTIKQFEVI